VWAPESSSQAAAIDAGRPIEDQLLLDAIERDVPGFCGDWISTVAATQHLAAAGSRLSPRRLATAIESIGYVRCPWLHDGRTTRMVLPDGGKTRLYVKAASMLTLNEMAPNAAMAAYQRAQGVQPAEELKQA
jgi:hypothetical protein